MVGEGGKRGKDLQKAKAKVTRNGCDTHVSVLADGLRHAGRQSVGRERVAPSQAELRRMSVSEVEVIFRVELYARTSPVPQKPNSPE